MKVVKAEPRAEGRIEEKRRAYGGERVDLR